MGKLLPRALPRNLHTKVFGLTFIDQTGPSVVSMRSVIRLPKFLQLSLHGAVWLLAVAQRFCSGQGFFFLTIARRVEGHRAKRGAPAWRCWLLIDTAPQPTQGQGPCWPRRLLLDQRFVALRSSASRILP